MLFFRSKMLSLLIFSFLFISNSVCISNEGTDFPPDKTIYVWRDLSGTPHIISSSTEGAYWGFGYCLAKDRMFQLELLRRSCTGTLSEVFGKNFLDVDFISRRDGISSKELEEGLLRSPQNFREVLKAFTSGINSAILSSIGKKIPTDPAFRKAGIAPRIFSELDILNIFANTMAVRYNDFTQELDNLHLLANLVRRFGARKTSAIFEDVIFFSDPEVFSTLSDKDITETKLRKTPKLPVQMPSTESSPSQTLRMRKKNRLLKSVGIPDKSGSYAVALSNRGNGENEAFLLGGPQMGYFKPSALYLVGLHTPKFDIVGTTPVGYFAILFGANRNIGFTATAGVANLVDIISLVQNPKDPSLLIGEKVRAELSKRVEHFSIKNEKQRISKEVRETTLGPVVEVDGAVHFVKHRAWKGRVIDSYAAWFDSNHSEDLINFLDASDRMALSINWLAADKSGHIGYVYCGMGKNRRSFGDDRLPCNRPTEFSYPEPRLAEIDPPNGFFANWNCPPVKHFRDGDLQTAWGKDQRTAFLAKMLYEQKGNWSLDFLKKLDKAVAFTDLRSFFFGAALAEQILEDSLSPHELKAFFTLKQWDGTRTDSNNDGLFDCQGAGLFDAFWNQLFGTLFNSPLGNHLWMIASDPTWTQSSILLNALKGKTQYDFFNGKPVREIVTMAFKKAVSNLASDGAAIPLIACPPMEFGGVNLAGAPSFSAPATFTPFMNRGSDVQLMSLTPEEIRIWGVLPPGNQSFGFNSSDQLDDYKNFIYRERPLTINQLKKKALRKNALQIP